MSYDNPNRVRYERFFDFGAGTDETISITGPRGKAGTLINYGVYGVTEVFAGTTITPKIAVGTTSDPDAYGDELDLNGLADNSSTSILELYHPTEAGYSIYMLNRNLPADTELYMTLTAATGSPTGQATAFVEIDWQD